jgi:hypothetical protein
MYQVNPYIEIDAVLVMKLLSLGYSPTRIRRYLKHIDRMYVNYPHLQSAGM